MAYRIEYAPSAKEIVRSNSRKMRFAGSVAILLTLILAVNVAGLADVLSEFLIPGDPEVTVAAWQDMVENLRDGENFHEAVVVFCKQILEGAGFEE